MFFGNRPVRIIDKEDRKKVPHTSKELLDRFSAPSQVRFEAWLNEEPSRWELPTREAFEQWREHEAATRIA